MASYELYTRNSQNVKWNKKKCIFQLTLKVISHSVLMLTGRDTHTHAHTLDWFRPTSKNYELKHKSEIFIFLKRDSIFFHSFFATLPFYLLFPAASIWRFFSNVQRKIVHVKWKIWFTARVFFSTVLFFDLFWIFVGVPYFRGSCSFYRYFFSPFLIRWMGKAPKEKRNFLE